MDRAYWLVRVYNPDGRLVESSGPFQSQLEAESVAVRKRERIDNMGWAYEVVVRQDEQFAIAQANGETTNG